jgi:hypothetical protein
MATITTRAGKGAPLTNAEVDANFTNLNTDKIEAADTRTLTNKTIAFGSNTLTDVASTNTTQTLTNKTLTSPVITTPTGIVKGDVGLGNVDNTSDATKNAATVTLTNKTINLASNTLQATSAQIAAAVTDETGTGALVFAGSPALTGTPTAPTAAAGTNTTQIASTAHVFAERTNTATLTNKTLTSPTINTATISGGTIDNTVIGGTTPAAGTFTTLTATGAVSLGGTDLVESVRVAQTPGSSGSNNYIEMFGSTGSGTPFIAPWGTNTNVGLNFRTRGAGAYAFATSSTLLAVQFRIAPTTSAVNFVQVTGAATGAAGTISSQGSDANIGLNLTTKGTFGGSFRNSAGSIVFSWDHSNTATENYIAVASNISTGAPSVSARGTGTNIDLTLTPKGTGAVRNVTGGGEQLRVSNTASAVNYVQVTGAATGISPVISAQGSDSSIDMRIQPKGSGSLGLMGGDGNTQIQVGTSAASGNTFLRVVRSNGFVDLQATSGVANGDITLTPKGTGVVREGAFPIVSQTDIGTAPNQIPLNQYLGNVAFMSSNQLVINPAASVTPNGIGDMVFELASDTSLIVKVKGSDGTVRSATLTLA